MPGHNIKSNRQIKEHSRTSIKKKNNNDIMDRELDYSESKIGQFGPTRTHRKGTLREWGMISQGDIQGGGP